MAAAVEDKNLTVRCTLCVGKLKELSSARSSMSNLEKHLERVHSNVKLMAKPGVASKQKSQVEDDGASTPKL